MYMASQYLIDQWIEEDVPYFDLTTTLLGIGGQAGSIAYYSRDPITVACVEIAGQILSRCDLKITEQLESGEKAAPNQVFLKAEGRAGDIHKAWKVTLNLLEYACGISTRTARLVSAARSVKPDIAVLTTRKVFPGTKAVSVSAAIAGGALPHRLGLGETILIFDNHLKKIGGYQALAKRLPDMKARVCDKEICVEVVTEEDALLMAEAGVDALQFDKVPPDVLKGIAAKLRGAGSRARLIAAGGVTADNAAAYADAGVDAISTTWIYFGKPADCSAIIL
jgi:molybdenum transport protein